MAETPISTAKINRRLATRTVIALFAVAGLLFAYNWFKGVGDNLDDLAKANTTGMIAAIQYLDDGQQAVTLSGDGTTTVNAGYIAGAVDRDLTWDPEGNRLYFVSDRGDGTGKDVKAFNIFSWNPAKNSTPKQRTIGTRGRSYPSFDVQATPDAKETALITSGGFVLEFDPKDTSTRQVLPPLGREVTVSKGGDDAGSSDSQFSALYGGLGNSFRMAKWMKNRKFIAGIMRRDEGEVLIIQNMEEKDGKFAPPSVVAAGSHIDIAINPHDGSLVYSLLDFQWPDPREIPEQFRKNNKVTRPLAHTIGVVDPALGSQPPIVANADDRVGFGSLAITPDGSKVAVVIGPYANGNIDPKAIVVFPAKPGAGGAGASLVQGAVYEPSWSADGKTLAYAKRGKDGKRDNYTIGADGEHETNLTKGKGNFGFPIFSPQSK